MWRVDTIQPDGTIKREQRSQTFLGLSERAARAKFQPILDAVNAANHATPPVPKTSDTVAKAVSEWRKHAAMSLKPSTRRSAESHLRRHILPLLGGCPLEDLTVKQMQTFVTTLAAGQRTAKTIENVLLTLSSILGAARKWGYKVPMVRISDLSLPRKTKARPRVYSASEMARIVSSADEPLERSVSYWARQGCELEKYSHSELTTWILNAILSMSVTRFLRVIWARRRVKRV